MPIHTRTAHPASRRAVRAGLLAGLMLPLAGLAAGAQTMSPAPATGPATTPATTPAATPVPSMPVAAAPPATAPMAPPAADPAASPGDGGGAISAAALQTALGHDKAARIEAHIARLHGDLKITPAQEADWQAFAGTMRGNAVQMDAAYTKRQQGYTGMNAVQDLQSYAEVEQTNAHNIAQLLPPFQTLYASMSPAQQKLADGIFVRHIDKAVKKPD